MYTTCLQLTFYIYARKSNMQLPNAPTTVVFPAIETAVQPERIRRYMPAAGMDGDRAFKFYLWNCALCEAFHISLHFCEIVCRNALNRVLTARCGAAWYENTTLLQIMDPRFRQDLQHSIDTERKQHGSRMTAHHVVSSLHFGFWEHLATKRFERFLWAKGIHVAFPLAPPHRTYEDLQRLIESVRRWRNRIAHHRAIFDKGPTRKHQDALELIGWICADTSAWVSSVSRVPVAISLRPK
jgi:hypothetical protein